MHRQRRQFPLIPDGESCLQEPISMRLYENEDLITRDVAILYAHKHKVCTFEFVLDVSLWADVIICDYNYVFDPQVYLKRFFGDDKEDYVFLK